MSNKRNAKQSVGATELINTQDALSLSGDEFLSRVGTSVKGLTTEEAESRRALYGSNEVVRKAKRSLILEFISHFHSPVTVILIIAAIVSGFLGDPLDAIIILSIVMVSVTLDFTQEYRAGKAAEALRKRVAT